MTCRPVELVRPQWSAPDSVCAVATTRAGGCSSGPFNDAANQAGGLNLGANAGDEPHKVQANRATLATQLSVKPFWLHQVHGTHVVNVDRRTPTVGEGVRSDQRGETGQTAESPTADAAVTSRTDVALAILSADCLPVVFASDRVVGAAHAGWRGLAAGVVEQTVEAMAQAGARAADIHVWFGPAIGRQAFEVGGDVRDAFCARYPDAGQWFVPVAGRADKWLADLYGLARHALQGVGVTRVCGGDLCTVSDPARFYSYRRDGQTGRMPR